MTKIAIFASGRGSNAVKIHQYSLSDPQFQTVLVITNKRRAGVLNYAKEHNLDSHIINRESFYNTTEILNVLAQANVDLLVLAGFLWLIPEYLIQAYPNKIINIHPALLPKYGGKGMYGSHIHEAVYRSGDSHSGITIHYVNEAYDEGAIILQTRTGIQGLEPESIASKVLTLEHHFYPRIVAGLASHFNASGKSRDI